MAAKGLDHEHLGTLPTVALGPDSGMVVRLLPPVFFDLEPGWDGLLVVEHEWRPWPDRVRAVCPLQTHAAMLADNKRHDRCPACEAGVPIRAHLLVHACLVDERRSVALKLSPEDNAVLDDLIAAGCFDFACGCIVELWRQGWRLHWRKLDADPVDEKDYKLWLEVVGIGVRRHKVKLELLDMLAQAWIAWKKAGQPEPRVGQHKELVKLLPEAVLLEIPWGFKAPQRFGWRDTTPGMMTMLDYLRMLDAGNIGLKCGLVKSGEPSVAIIGLDADTDEFALELAELNPWLDKTFCVRGARGCKWFFRVEGPPNTVEECARSTKIKRGETGMGDWLGEGKQGVVLGLHPSGCYYTHNGRPLTTLSLTDFALPTDCHFARAVQPQHEFVGGRPLWQRERRRTASVRTIRSALAYIDADERETWFVISCALKTWGCDSNREGLARELWDEWSSTSAKYDKGGQDKLWDSLGHRNGDAITVGSLFFMAQKNGWTASDEEEEDENYDE